MRVLGLRSYRNELSWAVVDGNSRATAVLVAHHLDSAPAGTRGEVLRWVRNEVTGLMNDHAPDAVVLCLAEGQQLTNATVERAQVDGIILEVTHSLGVAAIGKKSATIRSNFGANTKAALNAALGELAVTSDIPPTAKRREPTVAALSEIP
jgi:hypothetical protein